MPPECQISSDPDQARHFVGPGLGPNCFQRISADDASRQPVNMHLGPELQCLLRVKEDKLSIDFSGCKK